ncbi:hypothetical protein [Spirosoma sp.]|uniref:hypothetical protein n=1 Tax=Spirosoma sp. TaxID=1899569 RepID=UPI003B3A00F4
MKYLLLLFLLVSTAKSFAQVGKKAVTNKTVCDDPAVVDNFSQTSDPDRWHDYTVGPTKVCNTLESASCTKEMVYAMLLNNASLIAPGAEPIVVVNCGLYMVSMLNVSGPIRVRTNYANRTIENFTMQGHTLHPGKVTHKVEQIGNDVYLTTRGVGNGKWPLVYTNIVSTNFTWKPLHVIFRQVIADRLKKSFIPSEIQARWIRKPADGDEPSSNQKNTSYPCGFNWTAWSNISAVDKAAMRKVMVPDSDGGFIGSLLQYIIDQTNKGNSIKVARHDFYEKQGPGYLVYIEYPQPMYGAKGRIEVYEDLGKKYLFPPSNVINNLCSVRPASNNQGILGESGQQEYFTNTSLFFDKTYEAFLKETKQTVTVSNLASTNNTGRLGADSPEELAKLLLKCLKTNDKATWMRCLHPDDTVETDDVSANKFDRHREMLTSEGITNWSSVQFSRLTYPLRPMGGSKVDPNKTVPFSSVEFTYKNEEFVGVVKMGTFSFYEGKWLVWFCGWPEDDRVVRQMRR